MTSRVYGLHSGDGLIWYVGQTIQPLVRRLWEHRSRAKAGTTSSIKTEKINQAGDALSIQLLYEGERADAMEAVFIWALRPEANRQSGGRSGYTVDQRVRSAISESLSGRPGHWRGKTRPEASQPGEQNAMSKLTAAQVGQIREEYAKGLVSQYRLAKLYGVSQSHISAIIRRKRWVS